MTDDRGLRALVGAGTYQRGLDYARSGMVRDFQNPPDAGEVRGSVGGSGPRVYSTTVDYRLGSSGQISDFLGRCSCPVGLDCKHAVALLLTALGISAVAASRPVPARSAPTGPTPATWERALSALVEPGPEVGEPLGLAFELQDAGWSAAAGRPPLGRSGGRGRPAEPQWRLGIRPVRLGRQGRWVRTGISWYELGYLGYGGREFRPEHVRLLSAIAGLDVGRSQWQYGSRESWIHLDTIETAAGWDLLEEAVAASVTLMSTDKNQTPVELRAARAELRLELRRQPESLLLDPAVCIDGEPIDLGHSHFLGSPAHGLVSWRPVGQPEQLTLTRLTRGVDEKMQRFVRAGRVSIPAGEQDRFLQHYLPALRDRHPVVTPGDTVRLPAEQPPQLTLTVRSLPGHQLGLSWEWVYQLGAASRRLGLYPSPLDPGRRDLEQERQTLGAVTAALGESDHLIGRPGGLGAPRSIVTEGRETIDVITRVLPALREISGVRVELVGEVIDYRPAEQEPAVGLSSVPSAEGRDWFDLSVTVTVDGRAVPFEPLFRALAEGQEVMILADGTYFALQQPALHQLRVLIEEARALQDRPGGPMRISRFQAGLWEELAELGVPDEQSRVWLEQVRAWRAPAAAVDTGEPALVAMPAGLQATLRPYQAVGFGWLNLLREHGFGGILADDMGLGKTVQTLAMISAARAEHPQDGPFLVVAPTSVLSNWQAEAARFVPGLRTVLVAETAARRGVPLADAVAGADIVITSYTLFRLEYEGYAALPLAGLVLDEAQAVKNHQSKAFQCAKRLPVTYKLAITGTPMENNLMELWALFSVVAPGLFPNPARFSEYYRLPIERGSHPERLVQLRRRIRPLMLRRTKEQVAVDLPAKQEQILEVDLEPAHRTVYQRQLQRERQKILGLLGDLDRNRFTIFRSLMLLRQASIDVALIDPAYDHIPSTKLTVLMELLADVVAEGHRTLIFSQFTGFLHRVRARLDADGIEYCYLDGRTRNRPRVLADFKNGTAPVFLISLKAGGVGLNLTEADYCILLDPWWNPATEAQAVDRTHRIGQTRNVMVYRLVSRDTIEEKVMALKKSKAELFASVMGPDGADATGGPASAITASDIRALLD